jgi:hypothetical protein
MILLVGDAVVRTVWLAMNFIGFVILRTFDQELSVAMIALMMEAVRNCETSVHFNVTTRRYIPEDSKLVSHTNVFMRGKPEGHPCQFLLLLVYFQSK